MKIMIIRHADPDYSIDSLTEKGEREAALLAAYLKNTRIDAAYLSPKGRAQRTAQVVLEGREPETTETFEWLREFHGFAKKPHDTDTGLCWDWLPEDWMAEPIFYDHDKWGEHPLMREHKVKAEYDWVCTEFDKLLAQRGYVRDESGYRTMYRAERPNDDTLAFFCHFGVGSVIISHLMGVSPMTIWQHTCLLPSSVSTFISEERMEGKASFRACALGDTGHLAIGAEEPSFSGRFCERFTDETRH